MNDRADSLSPDQTPFWRFSGEVYGRPGVAEACLALQDRHGLDVNLLLFCAWAGSCGRLLDGGDLGLLWLAVRPWQDEVVAPLRSARRWLKQQVSLPEDIGEAFREEVKAMELQAEMMEQMMLYQEIEIDPGKGGAGDVAANLKLYMTRFKPLPGDNDQADLAAVLRGVCPEVTPLEAVWLLGNDGRD